MSATIGPVMPIIKSAIKKMRVDARRHAKNVASTSKLKTVIKKARTESTFEAISAAYSALDKAVKVNLIERNFANRQKSQLSRLAKPTKLTPSEKPKATIKKKSTVKKTPVKKTIAVKAKK